MPTRSSPERSCCGLDACGARLGADAFVSGVSALQSKPKERKKKTAAAKVAAMVLEWEFAVMLIALYMLPASSRLPASRGLSDQRYFVSEIRYLDDYA